MKHVEALGLLQNLLLAQQLLLVAKCNPELLEIASPARRCGSLEASMARAQSAAIFQASTAIRPALDKADRSSFGRIDYAGQMSAPGTFEGDKPRVLDCRRDAHDLRHCGVASCASGRIRIRAMMRHARRRHARGPLNWCSESGLSDVTPHLAFCFGGIVVAIDGALEAIQHCAAAGA
jgi:hypothetical protein